MSEVIHERGHYWRADEIAECLKVKESTYQELWGVVKLYENKPRGETPGEFNYCLAEFGWDKLSDEAKVDVNSALMEA